MKRTAALILALLIVWIAPVLAVPASLHQSDIQRVMERFFAFHIENKEFTPAIARRCFKLYIEQFDPEKAYLLESEVLSYLQMSDKDLAAVVQRVKSQNYSDFQTLNQTIQASIERAQNIRGDLTEQYIATGALETRANAAPPGRYAKSEIEIAERQKSRIDRFFAFYREKSPLNTADRRAKVVALLEKKLNRYENQYLYLKPDLTRMDADRVEHYLSLRILKAFAKSLDTHTAFFSPEEAQEMRMSLEKQFEGVGVILSEGIDGVMIAELVKGSPAEQSGQIKINDLLVEVDGISLSNVSFEEVLDLLKKRGQKDLVLGFKRLDERGNLGNKFQVVLKKRPIVMDEQRITASYEKTSSGGIIGKISLYSFYENGDGISSERDIREAIRSFREVGDLQGLVLDLRDNSGGFLSQAIKVAGLFVSNGVIVISKYGKGEVHYLRNIVGKSYFNGPLVVLTSKMSASASEIVAQALQDYGVGVIVGDERTFGKGSIQYQTVTDETADIFFKVTVGKYYTVSGRTTQIEGVKADIHVPTAYAPYNIGERYLEYPLSNDQVEPAYVDPLTDLDEKTQLLFQRKYMPYLQRVVSFWKKQMPELRRLSQARLAASSEFQSLLQKQDKVRSRQAFMPPNSIDEMVPQAADLQMREAVNVVGDMIRLEAKSRPAAAPLEYGHTGTDD